MIFSDEEVALGLKRIGRSPDAKFLSQLLTHVLISITSPGLSDGAVRVSEGRRTLASELIRALDLEQRTDGRTDATVTELAGRPASGSRRVASSAVARRVPLDPADA